MGELWPDRGAAALARVRPFVDKAGGGPYLRMGPAGPAVPHRASARVCNISCTEPALGSRLAGVAGPACGCRQATGLPRGPAQCTGSAVWLECQLSASYRECQLPGVPVTGSASYRECQLPGVPVTGSTSYREYQLPGVPVTGSTSYRECQLPGVPVPGAQRPGPQGPGGSCSGSTVYLGL
jgi:hypothetical protein